MEGLDEYIVVLRVELIFSVDPIYSLKNRQIRSSKQGRGTVILEFRKK